MTVRKAKLEDIQRIVEIESKCFEYPWSDRAFRWYLGKEGFLVSQRGTGVKGFIVAKLEPLSMINNINKALNFIGINTPFESMAHIQNLAVDPANQREGIGSELLNELTEICLRKNIKHMRLEVRVYNQAAVNFYKAHNFNEVRKIISYYENGDDAYLMKKDL